MEIEFIGSTNFDFGTSVRGLRALLSILANLAVDLLRAQVLSDLSNTRPLPPTFSNRYRVRETNSRHG